MTDIERGARNISIESIFKLAKALGLSISALFSPNYPNKEKFLSFGARDEDKEPLEILLVENDSKDVELTLEGFSQAKMTNQVHVARDGAAALDFLFARGKYSARAGKRLPQVVLLDLGLPKVHGLEVLRQIKQDERLRGLKVVVISASHDDQEINEAIRLGASAYIFKPVDFKRFAEITPELDFCWTLRRLEPAKAA